jgi:hypothetical protein
MSELGIVSISLGTTLAGSTVNGNTILSTATFHYANGTTGTIADVALATDDFDTTWLGDSTVAPRPPCARS